MSQAVAQLAVEALDRGEAVALLAVVAHQGSSPGRTGFLQALTVDRAAGSIGGGAVEHHLTAEVRLLLAGGLAPFVRRQVHQREVEDSSGMICSGEETVAVRRLEASDLGAARAWLAAEAHRDRGLLTLTPSGLAFTPGPGAGAAPTWQPGPEWRFTLPRGPAQTLHLVGGGHCALALARLAVELDFEVRVYDDRPELETFAANSWARTKTVLGHYREVADRLDPGPPGTDYVCVMTFGHRTDLEALRSLIGRDLAFLGVLGSRTKVSTMLATLEAEGIPRTALARLHAPLGLPIHSHTPAEIAVSIAAQLIRTRNHPRSPA